MKSGLWLITLGCFTLFPLPSHAQIIPDNSLGTENSQVNPNATINGNPTTQIEGGATRGSNLFHSFQDFNVNLGQQVYFANPADIANIFTRVTGNNPSNILGTLGVDGAANLFLLNPNGIIFGANAQLDIRGSFVASTADSILFNNGIEFSATNPQAPPLLTVNVPLGLQRGNNNATITNRGNLSVGGNFTLDATNLNLQGQLHAGGNLALKATDTVTIRDTKSNPFLATAYGTLVVQGNQSVDIFALNHADSGFYSYGDMTFRSDNPVGGDAHYWSGGNFRIERLDGSLGDLYSPYDPIIRSLGDVSFTSYFGTSLHIFASGSVNIPGLIFITGPDTVNGLTENITLSDNSHSVQIQGKIRPTLDIRAGVNPSAIGTPFFNIANYTPTLPGNIIFPYANPITNSATNTAINVGSVVITQPNGQVFLTNQYQPRINSNFTNNTIQIGQIIANGGDVIIDSRADVIANSDIITSGGSVKVFAQDNIAVTRLITSGLIGGSVLLDSDRGNITVSNTIISDSSTTTPGTQTGDITLNANSVILDNSQIRSVTSGAARSSNITINSNNIAITNGVSPTRDASIVSNTIGTGNAGKITLNAQQIELNRGYLFAQTVRRPNSPATPAALGNSGQIYINANQLNLRNGSFMSVASLSEGNGGLININADSVNVIGTNQQGLPSAFVFGAFNSGAAGVMQMNTNSLRVEDGALISGSAGDRVIGNLTQAGLLDINANDSIIVSGNGLRGPSSIVLETSGLANAGSINLATKNLFILNGGNVSGQTISFGNAGTLNVNADNILVDGISNDNRFQSRLFFASSSFGNAGSLNISTQRLQVSNGGIISALTTGFGIGGNLNINASESVVIDGKSSNLATGLFFNSVNSGNAGGIRINTSDFRVENGGQVTVSGTGTGSSGDLEINANSIWLNNQANLLAITESGTGGNIRLNVAEDVWLRNNSNILTEARGVGDGGNIFIHAGGFVLAVLPENSDIAATAIEGEGGDIFIKALGIFGFSFPERLVRTSESDVSAGSELGIDGTTSIFVRDFQPIVELPEQAQEPQIDTGCTDNRNNPLESNSSFIITENGGVAANPGDVLSNNTIQTPWAISSESSVSEEGQSSAGVSEAQGFQKLPNGEVILTSEFSQPQLPCSR